MPDFDLATLLRPKRIGVPPVVVATPARELSSQIVALQNMNDRCEVLRFLSMRDETGGTTTVWTQAGAYVCRVEDVQSARNSNENAQGIVPIAPYLLHLPRNAHILNEDRLGVPGWFNAWAPNTVYAEGARVLPPLDKPSFYIEAMYGGTSGMAPSPELWPSQPGQTLISGDVTWRYGGRVSFLEVVGQNDGATNDDELVIWAKEVG